MPTQPQEIRKSVGHVLGDLMQKAANHIAASKQAAFSLEYQAIEEEMAVAEEETKQNSFDLGHGTGYDAGYEHGYRDGKTDREVE